MFKALPEPLLTADTVAAPTQKRAALQLVYTALQHGNVHEHKGATFDNYHRRATELSTYRDCIIFRSRAAIPKELHDKLCPSSTLDIGASF